MLCERITFDAERFGLVFAVTILVQRKGCVCRRSPLKKGSGCKNPLENGKAEVQTPCHPWFHLWSYQRILRIKNCRTPWDDWLFRHFIYSVRQSWQAAPIKISTVFLVFSMVSAFLARFLELAASYCWLLLCNQKRYCGFYGIWCGLHDSVSDLHFDGFPVLRGSGHKSACFAQCGWPAKRRSMCRAWLHEICAGFSYSVFSAV